MDRKNHIREDMGIRHTVNFRGLGGYAADGGRVIKRGVSTGEARWKAWAQIPKTGRR